MRVLGENVVEDAVQQDIQEQKALEENRQVEQMPKGSIHEKMCIRDRLPALARLLKIDMNELFSFREELTEKEIGLFVNELSEVSLDSFTKA